jgi:hypothetical protein
MQFQKSLQTTLILQTFIETGKTKIIKYYETKCADIIKKSDGFVKMQQFEASIRFT